MLSAHSDVRNVSAVNRETSSRHFGKIVGIVNESFKAMVIINGELVVVHLVGVEDDAQAQHGAGAVRFLQIFIGSSSFLSI